MFRARFLFLLTIVFFYSCKEETQVNLISGQLFNDCSSPLPAFEIALKANVGEDFGNPIILGSGITRGDGAFEFTYELEEEDEGTGALILITTQGFETLIGSITLNSNLSLTLYRANNMSLAIELSGSKVYAADDTLFYGLDYTNEIDSIIMPMNSILDTFLIEVPNRVSGATSATLYYGIGKADFLLSQEASSIKDSVFQNISLSLNGCTQENDTALIVISQ